MLREYPKIVEIVMQNSTGNIYSTIKFQFDISWSLLEIHLNGLDDEICLWRPCSKGLYVAKKSAQWYPDWPDSVGYGIGPPNIAWLTWHIIFWWSMVLDHSFSEGTLKRECIYWPGTALDTKK
jgi:hypothetical protein